MFIMNVVGILAFFCGFVLDFFVLLSVDFNFKIYSCIKIIIIWNALNNILLLTFVAFI